MKSESFVTESSKDETVVVRNPAIAVLTYDQRHRKTYDTLCLLKAKGYQDVKVFAQKMTYAKKRYPFVDHRPELVMNIPEPDIICKNLGYTYTEGEFDKTTADMDDRTLFLLCGSGLLPEDYVTKHKIINSHPGYIPLARGLDSYKWSVYYDLPFGVTTHFIGKYIDGGEIIERREIKAGQYDTFHSVAQRVYENEIDMLVGAIELADYEHDFVVPDSTLFKRMPPDIEKTLFKKFEDRIYRM